MSQTVLIGLDGATFTILNALFETGDMPFLKDFVARGAQAELSSTRHFISPQAWTSMITGRTPGHHGIFDFIHCRQTAEGVYFTLNMSYDIRCPTLWTILSRKGLRVAALNFLVSYPPEPMNGVCVPGFIHARHLRQSVHPPAFYDKIRSLLGVDTKLLSMDMAEEFQAIQYLPAEQYESWINHHIRREEQWFNLVSSVLAENAPDLTALVFDGVDKLQHLCWRFLDPALYPAHPNPWEARIRDLCISYFRRLDGFIREIVTMAGPARIFLASDHGFCATETVFFANTWLAQRGYLRWKTDTGTAGSTQISDDRISGQVDAIDFDHTVAFALNPSSNGIYIRYADGPASPGVPPEQYASFRRRLADELRALTDPDSGDLFFREVLSREEAYPGEAAARAPDLTLVMKDYGFLSVLNSDEVFRRRSEPWGTHHPQGIFIAGGPGISPLGKMLGLDIIDIAPILLRSLGLPPEPEMEGRCPDALFDDDAPLAGQETFNSSECSKSEVNLLPTPSSELAEVEPDGDADVQAEVLKRLRTLGYLA
jgi:predicted AlkP superfamily phosphohydrolase/phosphomutase